MDENGVREWSTKALVNYAASLLQTLNNLKLVTWPYSGSVSIKEGNRLHLIDYWWYFGSVKNEEQI